MAPPEGLFEPSLGGHVVGCFFTELEIGEALRIVLDHAGQPAPDWIEPGRRNASGGAVG